VGQEEFEADMQRARGTGFAALLSALAVVGGGPSRADDTHSYNLINASASRVDFADQKAQRRSDGSIIFSILTVFPAGPVSWSLSQVSLNCASQQIATLASETHAADGAIVPHDALDTAAQPIAPATLGQALKVIVCDGADPYPRSKLINGTDSAIALGRKMIGNLKTTQ
jgi:hypothetical protein